MSKNSKQPKPLSILFVDDEECLQELMRENLPMFGHRVTVCPDGETALAAMDKNVFDCMLVDLTMPGMSGIEVIERAREKDPDIDAVILTGNGSLETAVDALRFRVVEYLTKPCEFSELRRILDRISANRELQKKYNATRRLLEQRSPSPLLIGEHSSMAKVRQLVARVALTNSTVMIRGETGCGKELVARAVHDQSLRAKEAFVAVNCGALPENLIESELFGHRKGAFTGADEKREGLFSVADGGTLFLDEIGELPLAMQAKLLRVLESGEIRRVGDNEVCKIDVRIVCATHRNLEQMVEEGTFREDLMFRINTFEIPIPPLRDRISDIPQLAIHLYRRFRNDATPDDKLFSPETVEELVSHVWPGNVRELANVIEHATILCDSPPILPEHLPRHFSDRRLRKDLRSFGPMSLRDMEIIAIQEAVERHQGNKQAAADELGVSLKTLYNKLNQVIAMNKAA